MARTMTKRYSTHENTGPSKEEMLSILRRAARRAWRRRAKDSPHEEAYISANTIRHLLLRHGYKGDPRILGSVFRDRTAWQPVGWVRTNSPVANPRDIRTFAYYGK